MLNKKALIIFITICLSFTATCFALDYDANDFLIEVIEYVEGSGVGSDWITGQPFNDPCTALGRPTLETTGEGFDIPIGQSVPVVPVYPPFRFFEIVTIGTDGHLTLKFNHQVANDKNNLYGIDLIIFGNTLQSASTWRNGNPENHTLGGTNNADMGIVSVSQDGITWYSFTNNPAFMSDDANFIKLIPEANDGPFCDNFAPTASYNWDRVNDLWADELDPTRPIDPNLTAADFSGNTLADMIDAYEGSAGGTGFDIGQLGLEWIMYVRIDNRPGSADKAEIDAIADVSACGDYKHPYPIGDLNGDCRVDFVDMASFTGNWLDCTWQCD